MKATRAAIVSALAGLAVLGIHSGAWAQQAEPAPPEVPQYPQANAPPQNSAPPAPSAAPPYEAQPVYPPGYGPPPGYAPPQGYAPPTGYGPPPPRYYAPPRAYGRPRYAYYPPPPPPPPYSLERPFMLGGSLGLATLHYHPGDGTSTSDAAVGYSARLGFGLSPRLLFLIEINGATASGSDGYYASVAFDQTIYDLGLQVFLTRRLFLRGGAGLGNIRAWDDGGTFDARTGFAMTASVGLELLQGYNWSFELAGQWITGFYSDGNWTSGAVNLGFNFF